MERFITALRAGRPEHTPEAEGVLVTLTQPNAVTLTLDDGETLTFDAAELRAAVFPMAERIRRSRPEAA